MLDAAPCSKLGKQWTKSDYTLKRDVRNFLAIVNYNSGNMV